MEIKTDHGYHFVQYGIDPSYKKTSGYKVWQLRTSLQENQRQFAKRFHVSQAAVWRWETNRGEPPREVLEMQTAPNGEDDPPTP